MRHKEAPANVTFPLAMGNFQRVYNTTYHVVNRYAVIKRASYRSGEIEAEIGQDNALFDKTRRTILARVVSADGYFDVECRVLIAVEQSEVANLSGFVPRDEWHTVASDPLLETRLNNEIKSALTGGAFEAKTPLTPEGKSATPQAHPRIRITPSNGEREGRRPAATEPRKTGLREARVAPGDDEGERNETEKLGLKLMEKGLYAKAVEAFRVTLEKGGAPHAPYLLAQSLFATGDYKGAARAIRDGAARCPEWPSARIDLRGFYGDATDLRSHVAALEKFQHEHEGDRDAALVLGYVAYFSGDYKRARAAFDLLPASDGVADSYRRLVAVELDRARGLEEF